MKIRKQDFFTIPNILTYIRIILVPIFCVVYMNANSLADNIWSVAIVVVSALTDVIDGIIARKCNLVTDLGKIIDPIADKAMQFAMLFCVVYKYHSIIILIIIYAVKEIVSFIYSSYLFTKGKNIGGAIWCGKICTAVLYAVMLILISVPTSITDKHPAIVGVLVGFAAAFMLLAFVIYMSAYVKLHKEYQREQILGEAGVEEDKIKAINEAKAEEERKKFNIP